MKSRPINNPNNLVQCPECGALVDSNVQSCPNCGAPINNNGPFNPSYQQPANVNPQQNYGPPQPPVNQPPYNSYTPDSEENSATTIVVVATVVIIVIVLIIFGVYHNNTKPAATTADSDTTAVDTTACDSIATDTIAADYGDSTAAAEEAPPAETTNSYPSWLVGTWRGSYNNDYSGTTYMAVVIDDSYHIYVTSQNANGTESEEGIIESCSDGKLGVKMNGDNYLTTFDVDEENYRFGIGNGNWLSKS